MVLPTPSVRVAWLHVYKCSRFVLGTVIAAALSFPACTCGGSDASAEQAKPAVELAPRRVPDTDLVVALPQGWRIDLPDPGPMPAAPPATDTKIVLHTRTLLEARPGTPAPGMLVTPQLFVFLDPWLPLGTTGVDYLVAQRTANQRVIGANIRHVDAEPSRREGRPTYHIRDEWTVVSKSGESREVSQEALLLLDPATTADGRPAMHGITVVVTLEKAEFLKIQPTIRAIMNSIRFEARERSALPSRAAPNGPAPPAATATPPN